MLRATGASVVRARVRSLGAGGVALEVWDTAGVPVLTVESFRSRPVDAGRLSVGGGAGLLHGVEWRGAGVSAGAAAGSVVGSVVEFGLGGLPGEVPAVGVLRVPAEAAHGVVPDVHEVAGGVLEAVQGWLADERLTESTLVVVVPEPAGEAGLVVAPVCGLVRSVQAEVPGRVVLVRGEASAEVVASLAGLGEPEVRVRDGLVEVPRLVRLKPVAAGAEAAGARPARAGGTVLVTGGSGGVGGALARHLVVEHAVASLLLVSRSGRVEPELRQELEALGAVVEAVACDVSDRAALGRVVEAAGVLRGVVHAAGVLDDGLFGALTRERVSGVLRSKADAAWYLHELTAGMDLEFFVLCSSGAAVVDAVGQANYAAGNVFLDALAEFRVGAGLPGLSVQWGLWSGVGGMGERLSAADRERIARGGLPGLSPAENLAAFDAALASGVPVVMPVRVDRQALRTRPDG
ncbi:SDR family NAD(P)-dependent oxidoreductase, partial [Streptomyces sp. M2CJ-2]|uniref:beta-ketoacyl reductase n=1 Tax=Streptomyces sp. M2CJ-2 TaxID=2803948 RepID=UPI0019263833